MTLPTGDEDLFGERTNRPRTTKPPGKLASRFLLPPFSVLNAREGYWQERKRAWILLGIQSELGRGGNLLSISDECEQYRRNAGDYAKDAAPGGGGSGNKNGYFPAGGGPRPDSIQAKKHNASLKGGLTYGLTQNPYGDEGEYQSKKEKEAEIEEQAFMPSENRRPVPGHTRVQGPSQPGLTHHLTIGAYTNRGGEVSAADCGTSIFDPVICELMYTWFCPAGGQIVDPFAGGSVRGIVAGVLGRDYWGCDLAANQVAANRIQAEEIEACRVRPKWVTGDSKEKLAFAPYSDFLFSCPPYGDLEKYSDDPRDLSTMSYDAFLRGYSSIIFEAADTLRPDRFAAFVVGDFRDRKTGYYRNFPADTTAAFRAAGLELYNEFILVTAVGSLSIRTEKQFRHSRKNGKTHQTVLVYVKGDPVKAAAACEGKE